MKLPLELIQIIAKYQQVDELAILATTSSQIRQKIYTPNVLIIYSLNVFDEYDSLTKRTMQTVGIKNCIMSKLPLNMAIATIPESLASRVTHIVATVMHGYDCNINAPAKLLPDDYNRFIHGKKFTKLSKLELDYPAGGHTCIEKFSPLASLLIIFLDWTKNTLKRLALNVRIRLTLDDICLIYKEFNIPSVTIEYNPWSPLFGPNRSQRELDRMENRRRYLDHVKETGEWDPTELYPSLMDLYSVRALRDCNCI